jgi:hypothetical protein
MPQLIPAVIAAASSLGLVTAAGGLTFLGSVVVSVIGAGLSFLASIIFAPKPPKPSDCQFTIKQAAGPRVAHYGQVKVGGTMVFAEASGGDLHRIFAIAGRRISAFLEHWADDTELTLDGNGWTVGGKYDDHTGPRLQVKTRVGLPTETAYSEVTSVYGSQWTSSHRGDGIASVMMLAKPVDAEEFSEVYPNGEPQYRAVIQGCRVYDPGSEVTEYNDNAALVALDYMRNADGMAISDARLLTPQAKALWIQAAGDSEQNVDTADGAEDRYRIWGSYDFGQRPVDVLNQMMAACDGRPVPTADGGIGFIVGRWRAPTVTITAEHIRSYDFGAGNDAFSEANLIRARFLYAPNDYQETDAEPWPNVPDIAERGEIAADMDLYYVPSNGQCRRLMKIESRRRSPEWVGTITTDLVGLAALGERWITLVIPELGINDTFEIDGVQIILAEENTITGAALQVRSMDSTAYDWDAENEEGRPPEVPVDDYVPPALAPPTGIDVSIGQLEINGETAGAYAQASWDDSGESWLYAEGRYRKQGTTAWRTFDIEPGSNAGTTGLLEDGEEYDFQFRYVTVTGTTSLWSTVITETAVSDVTAPGPVTGLVPTGGVGVVSLDWRAPASANFAWANIYRSTINTFGTATIVSTVYGGPNDYQDYDETLAAGTYYYWVRSSNASRVEGTAVASGAVVVT